LKGTHDGHPRQRKIGRSTVALALAPILAVCASRQPGGRQRGTMALESANLLGFARSS
jgi:hypothetical protein